jgi:heterotetrameric sarcosine oxidase gamma subunit
MANTTVSERDGLGIATVLVRKGKTAALAERLREHFQIELPQGPRRATSGTVAVMGIAPEAWLATQEQGGNAFATSLKKVVGELASISDQSDGYRVWRLSGPKARDILCRIVPIDVHPRAFKVGDSAVTAAAHMGTLLWRIEDADGWPVFETAIFRSFAGSFRHLLDLTQSSALHPAP